MSNFRILRQAKTGHACFFFYDKGRLTRVTKTMETNRSDLKKKRNLVFGKQGKCSTLEGSGNEDPNKNWRNDWLVSEFKFLNPQNMVIPWGQFNMSFPAVIIQHS